MDNPYLTLSGADVRETAWNLAYLVTLVDERAGRYWDTKLRDFEDEYVTREVWVEAIAAMREITDR